MTAHLIRRVTVLGTGLIGGSFALALSKTPRTYTFPAGIARSVADAHARGALDEAFSGDLAPRSPTQT